MPETSITSKLQYMKYTDNMEKKNRLVSNTEWSVKPKKEKPFMPGLPDTMDIHEAQTTLLQHIQH